MVISDWISVKDQLPEREEKVLIYTNDFDIEIAFRMAKISEENGSGSWWYYNTRWSVDEVTHWMPLPNSPKE